MHEFEIGIAMKRIFMVAPAVSLIVLSLSACSSSKEYKSLDEARADIQGAGVACGDPSTDSSSRYSTASLSCGSAQDGLQVSLYPSDKAFQAEFDDEKSLAFAIAKGKKEYVLHGSNWAVYSRNDKVVEKLHGALGGERLEIAGTGKRDLFG